MRTILLKKKEDRRIKRGHPWVFSNEVQALPADVVPGELVEVRDFAGGFIGRGYVNPRSLIAVSLYVDGAHVFTRNRVGHVIYDPARGTVEEISGPSPQS